MTDANDNALDRALEAITDYEPNGFVEAQIADEIAMKITQLQRNS